MLSTKAKKSNLKQREQELIPVYPGYPILTEEDTMDILDWIPAFAGTTCGEEGMTCEEN